MTRTTLWGLFALVVTSPSAFSETVQLITGDVVHGHVVSLDEEALVLESKALGKLTVQRSDVASIHLGETSDGDATGQDREESKTTSPGELTLPRLDLNENGSPSNPLSQLAPLLLNPEVQQHFQNNLEGLLSGEIDVENLRGQAENARNLMKEYKKELGPNADVVEGYLNILDSFLDQSEPSNRSHSQ